MSKIQANEDANTSIKYEANICIAFECSADTGSQTRSENCIPCRIQYVRCSVAKRTQSVTKLRVIQDTTVWRLAHKGNMENTELRSPYLLKRKPSIMVHCRPHLISFLYIAVLLILAVHLYLLDFYFHHSIYEKRRSRLIRSTISFDSSTAYTTAAELQDAELFSADSASMSNSVLLGTELQKKLLPKPRK